MSRCFQQEFISPCLVENLNGIVSAWNCCRSGSASSPQQKVCSYVSHRAVKAGCSFKLGWRWRKKAETVGAAGGCKAVSEPTPTQLPPLGGLMAHIGFLFLFKTPLNKGKQQFPNSGKKSLTLGKQSDFNGDTVDVHRGDKRLTCSLPSYPKPRSLQALVEKDESNQSLQVPVCCQTYGLHGACSRAPS